MIDFSKISYKFCRLFRNKIKFEIKKYSLIGDKLKYQTIIHWKTHTKEEKCDSLSDINEAKLHWKAFNFGGTLTI